MVVDDDRVSRSIIGHFVEKTEYLELVHSCEGAVEARNILKKDDQTEVLFLDIEMPEMSGLELIQSLSSQKLDIILITSREKYAVEAFEYSVIDYLVKPINYVRFLKATDRVLEKREEEREARNNPDFLFVRANHKIVKIDPTEISHIEALSDYIVIYSDQQKLVVHSTMKGIEKKLEPFEKFVRVHRSYIVNVAHIESIQDVNVIVKGKNIPIGRSYKNQFMERLDIL